MAGMNSVHLVGRVGADPDMRRFNDGNTIVEFSLATSETWRDRNSGERKEKTQWHRIKITNENVVKIACDYVKKGSLVGIEGQLEYRQWEKDGQKHTMAEIVVSFTGRLHLLGGKDDGDGGSRGRSDDRGHSQRRGDDYGARSGGGRPGNGGGGSFSRDLDDDIPFAPEWRG